MQAGATALAEMAKGAVAGAVGVWVMDRLDWYMVEREDQDAWHRTQAVRPNSKDPAHNMADMAARVIGAEPFPQPHPAGIAVHYAVGMAPTAIYGAARQHLPGGVIGRGVMLGVGMFLVEDEVLNTALGTAAKPTRYPWQAHARGLVTHLVLGLVTEALLTFLDEPRQRRQ